MKRPFKVMTVLPILNVDSLSSALPAGPLLNGYSIVQGRLLKQLEGFNKSRNTAELGLIDISSALKARSFLAFTSAHQFPPSGTDHNQIFVALCNQHSERIDRFLTALNLNNCLWTFRPDVRFSWYTNDYPSMRRYVNYRHHYPITTSQKALTVSHFRKAARLTKLLDKIYTENGKNDKIYPGIRVALDAIRYGIYTTTASIRYLQEAIVLETLASTDNQEVTHRVRLAGSLLLARNFNGRELLYKKLGDLYKKRSELIHGGSSKVNLEQLKQIEEIARRLLQRVIQPKILPNYRTRDLQRKFLLDLQLGRKRNSRVEAIV